MLRLARFVAVLAVLVGAVRLLAAPTTIKLATQAPTGSMWFKSLNEMGAAWAKQTEGRITLNVFGDGKLGDESTTVKKMRIGDVQAALLTAGGLGDIDKAFNVFTMPFFFQTDDEELAVQKKLEPTLEDILKAKHYHLLAWGTGGWVEVFSKKPLKNLADIKGAKLYASKGDDAMIAWYTSNGFHPQPMDLGEIKTALSLPNGLIDTAPDTPYLALTMQIYTSAKYMLSAHISPLVGALIMTSSAWDAISAADQAKLTAAARAMETEIRAAAPAQDDSSIKAMAARGLQVITPDAQAAAEFRTAADSLIKSMRGTIVPEDIYNIAVAERDAVRKSKGRG